MPGGLTPLSSAKRAAEEAKLRDAFASLDKDGAPASPCGCLPRACMQLKELRQAAAQRARQCSARGRVRTSLCNPKIPHARVRPVACCAGSGYIDASELGALLAGMGYKASKAEVAELLQLMDTDRNGVVDFEEFSRVLAGRAEVGGDSRGLGAAGLAGLAGRAEVGWGGRWLGGPGAAGHLGRGLRCDSCCVLLHAISKVAA